MDLQTACAVCRGLEERGRQEASQQRGRPLHLVRRADPGSSFPPRLAKHALAGHARRVLLDRLSVALLPPRALARSELDDYCFQPRPPLTPRELTPSTRSPAVETPTPGAPFPFAPRAGRCQSGTRFRCGVRSS